MTHWKKLRNPNTLGAWDFEPNERKVLTIDRVEIAEVIGEGGRSEMKPHVYWTEKDRKPMVLNVTNSKAIALVAGTPHIEKWNGVTVELYTTTAKLKGEEVEAIRVMPRKPETPATAEQIEQIAALIELKTLTDEELTKLGDWKKYDTNQAKRCITWLTGK